MIKYSFIIASYGNRKRQLQDCIVSIEKAYKNRGVSDVEVLVVLQDISANDCSIETKYPGLLCLYSIEGKGLARARNYAVKKAKGDFLIFLDDDARIKEDFLGILSDSLSTDSAEAFCGRIFEQDGDKYFQLCFADDKKRCLKREDFKYFMGSSHIFKRSLVDKVGFYDEMFGAGAKYPAAEESDMFFRIMRRSLKVVYLPDLVFYHPAPYQTDARKVFDYSYATGAMLIKQAISDINHFFTYFFIIAELLLKSFLRFIQSIFLKSIRLRNERFHYRFFMLGMLKGMFDYAREKDKEL